METLPKPLKPSTNTDKPGFTYGKTYVMRLRQHQGDNFHHLWALELLDPKKCENIKVIEQVEDANALNYTMDNLQGLLERDGF